MAQARFSPSILYKKKKKTEEIKKQRREEKKKLVMIHGLMKVKQQLDPDSSHTDKKSIQFIVLIQNGVQENVSLLY